MDAPAPRPCIEVFADPLCPFTHLGLTRLVAERQRRGRTEPALWVRAWPLELINGVPLRGEDLVAKVDALRNGVAPDLFGGFDPSRVPQTTLPALTLAAAAYRRDVGRGEAVSLALRAAVFESRFDIGDPLVLAEIAAANGIGETTPADAESIRRDWSEGAARGVIGSPHFFVGGASYFCPALAIAQSTRGLDISMDESGFGEFAARVFDDPSPHQLTAR